MNNFQDSSSPIGLANWMSNSPLNNSPASKSNSLEQTSPESSTELTEQLTPMASTPKPFNTQKITETWRLPVRAPQNIEFKAPAPGTPPQKLDTTLPSPGYSAESTPVTSSRENATQTPDEIKLPTPQLVSSPRSVSPAEIRLSQNAVSANLPKVTTKNITLPTTTTRAPQITPKMTIPSQPKVKTAPQPTETSQPQFPAVTIPESNTSVINLSEVNTLRTFVPTILADNETGDLRWNRPDRPQPKGVNSSYRRVGCIADGSCFFHAISKGLSSAYQSSYHEPNKKITEDTLRKLQAAVNSGIIFPSQLFTEPRSNNSATVYTIQPNMYESFINLMNRFRFDYIKILRQDFANKIMSEKRMSDIIKNRFEGRINLTYDMIVANSNEERIGKGLPQLEVVSKVNRLRDKQQDQFVMERALQSVKEQLAQELLSGEAVQPDFMLILSEYVNVDIYLLRDKDLNDPNPKNTPLYGGTSLHTAIHGPKDMRSNNDVYRNKPDRRAIVLVAIDDFHYEVVARVDQNESHIGSSYYIHPNMSAEEPLVRQLYQMLKTRRALDEE